MQYVPSDLPPPHQPEQRGISRVVPVQPTKEETAQPIAPFVFDFKPQQVRRPSPKIPVQEQQEPVFRERNQGERRRYCRRLQNNPFLYEVRLMNDRRRKNQRRDDITTAVDEIV